LFDHRPNQTLFPVNELVVIQIVSAAIFYLAQIALPPFADDGLPALAQLSPVLISTQLVHGIAPFYLGRTMP
jgi:hypothetical protein